MDIDQIKLTDSPFKVQVDIFEAWFIVSDNLLSGFVRGLISVCYARKLSYVILLVCPLKNNDIFIIYDQPLWIGHAHF